MKMKILADFLSTLPFAVWHNLRWLRCFDLWIGRLHCSLDEFNQKLFFWKNELHKRISEKEKIYNKVFLPALPNPAVARTIGAAATAPTPASVATPAAFRIRSPKKLQNVISSYFVTKQKGIIFFSVICVSWNEIKKNTGVLGTNRSIVFRVWASYKILPLEREARRHKK